MRGVSSILATEVDGWCASHLIDSAEVMRLKVVFLITGLMLISQTIQTYQTIKTISLSHDTELTAGEEDLRWSTNNGRSEQSLGGDGLSYHGLVTRISNHDPEGQENVNRVKRANHLRRRKFGEYRPQHILKRRKRPGNKYNKQLGKPFTRG